MQGLLAALKGVGAECDFEIVQTLLESAEAARATQQADRALAYSDEGLSTLSSFFKGASRDTLLSSLDGTQEKVVEVMDGGEACEKSLDALVTEAQLRQLRGELLLDLGKLSEAEQELEIARTLSVKLCDDVAVGRCLRSEGMRLLMKKELNKAEEKLEAAVKCCHQAEDPKEEAATLKLLIPLYKATPNRYDRCCECFHQMLEALQAEGDMEGVSATLLDLGNFRLNRHLNDTTGGSELEFAELEMTDLDLQGALQYYQENGGEDPSQLPEVLVSVGTIKMLLGDQAASVAALEQAKQLYEEQKDDDGVERANGLLSDVKRIMDKVDSTSVTPIG